MCACAVSFSLFYLFFFNCCVRQARIRSFLRRKNNKTVAQVIMDACAAYIYYTYKSKIEQEQDLDVYLVCCEYVCSWASFDRRQIKHIHVLTSNAKNLKNGANTHIHTIINQRWPQYAFALFEECAMCVQSSEFKYSMSFI